ncbi:MAG: hypothetical protein ABI707_07675 [Ferruginibacter sp.]
MGRELNPRPPMDRDRLSSKVEGSLTLTRVVAVNFKQARQVYI